jgi:endoglucanase
MIDAVAAKGFKTIRVPVSWHNHIVDANYTIDTKWLERVKEIVDWSLESGMNVIINIHHDNMTEDQMSSNYGFCVPENNAALKEQSLAYIKAVWTQVAAYFKNYGNMLVFEVLNEPRLCGTSEEWWYNSASIDSIKAMNNLKKPEQAILDVIRASDGNNKKRLVAFPSLQASPDSAFAGTFKMPQDYDYKTDRLIVSVHMYTPYSFAMESPGIKVYSDNVKKEFTNIFKRLNDTFITKGYAVYISEYGATNKNNLEDRLAWFHDFIKESRAYGMPCFLWDNGVWKVEDDKYDEHYGYYNRYDQTWYFPEIIETINSEIQ